MTVALYRIDSGDIDGYDVGDIARVSLKLLTQLTRGNIDSGSTQLRVADAAAYANGQEILVAGAGLNGADLRTTVSSLAGSVLTLADAALDTARNATVGRLTDASPDPTAKAEDPDGTETAATVVRDGVGRYHADVTLSKHGTWYVRFLGTGSAAGAGETALGVRHSRFA